MENIKRPRNCCEAAGERIEELAKAIGENARNLEATHRLIAGWSDEIRLQCTLGSMFGENKEGELQ